MTNLEYGLTIMVFLLDAILIVVVLSGFLYLVEEIRKSWKINKRRK